MEMQTLHSGNTIPVMGLGTWQLTNNTAETVNKAIDLGYRLIDTSSDYGSQPGIGQAVNTNGIDRDKLYIITKVEETDDAYQATKDYLDEMDLEYADLMLIHRPPKNRPGIDLWRGLIQAKNEGLTKDIGVSNYDEEQIDQLINATNEVPVINQIEWTPFGHSNAMQKYAEQHNMLIQAYSPLTRTKRLNSNRLQAIAHKYDKSPAQILIRWNIQKGSIPIPKASEDDHLEENIQVFDFELTDDDMNALENLNEEYSSLGGLPYV